MAAEKDDIEVHISFDDQKKINKFANLHHRLMECNEVLKSTKARLQTLEGSESHLDLADDDDKFMYVMGEIFLFKTTLQVKETLKEDKEKLVKNAKLATDEITRLNKELADLKCQLYAKFGTHIFLEEDGEEE